MSSTGQDKLNMDAVRQQLAPDGTLRVALNMSNFLLVSTTDDAGKPEGVSPSMAKAIAEDLGVALQLIPYEGPGLVADAAERDEWDIATIAAEPARAKLIRFSPAYCEIQASYLLPAESHISRIEQIDRPRVRIAVKERAAYDLWLTDNLQHASLHRASSHDATFELFVRDKLDALAGLRPKLLEQQSLLPGSVLIEESFTSVQQAIGCKHGNDEAARYLADFVTAARERGDVSRLIDHYAMTGKLSV